MKPEDIESFLVIIKNREEKTRDAEGDAQKWNFEYQRKANDLTHLETYLQTYHPEIGSNFSEMIAEGRKQYNEGISKIVSKMVKQGLEP